MPSKRSVGQVAEQHNEVIGRFNEQDATSRQLVSKVELAFDGLMRALVDEAKEGPRLFSFEPMDPGFFDSPQWINVKFRLTLWCEHSRLPLPALNGADDERGVYELTLPKEWLIKAAPLLRRLTGTSVWSCRWRRLQRRCCLMKRFTRASRSS